MEITMVRNTIPLQMRMKGMYSLASSGSKSSTCPGTTTFIPHMPVIVVRGTKIVATEDNVLIFPSISELWSAASTDTRARYVAWAPSKNSRASLSRVVMNL